MSTELEPSLASTYALVADRLPEHRFLIRRLISEDEAFLEMCSEFSEARAALERRLDQDGRTTAGSAAEWTEIVERLTAEISTYITSRQAK
ncbi:MAG: hypothetical protein JXR75_05190 [Rhodobacteraceae bacterium]|nr:hypothetical protein [Paracoccaceae bacterium]